MAKTTRFSGLMQGRRPDETKSTSTPADVPAEVVDAPAEAAETEPPLGDRSSTAKTRGRPRTGKRSNPAYTPITAFIRRDTRDAVAMALMADGRKRDTSDVIQELLAGWLKSR